MQTGNRYRIYPTPEQAKQIELHIKNCGFVWNWYLGQRFTGLFIDNLRKLILEGDSEKIANKIRSELYFSLGKYDKIKLRNASTAELADHFASAKFKSELVRFILTLVEKQQELEIDAALAAACIEREYPADRNLTSGGISKKLTILKKGRLEWLNATSAQALNAVVRTADQTFGKYFKKKCNKPKFRRDFNSFSNQNNTSAKGAKQYQNRITQIGNSHFLTIPKLPNVKLILHREYSGLIGTVTISRTASNAYYASFPTDVPHEPKIRKITKKTAVGIDVGLKNYITTSDGQVFEPPHNDTKLDDKIRFLQNMLQKKRDRNPNWKTSKRYRKQQLRLARAQERVANQRSDHQHKCTRALVNGKYSVICTEDLNVQGMLKNKKISRSISRAGLHSLSTKLEYKSRWEGITVKAVGRFFPSSKLCSECGTKNDKLTLSDRTWTCSNCGKNHDRDLNAAINIKNEVLSQLDL